MKIEVTRDNLNLRSPIDIAEQFGIKDQLTELPSILVERDRVVLDFPGVPEDARKRAEFEAYGLKLLEQSR